MHVPVTLPKDREFRIETAESNVKRIESVGKNMDANADASDDEPAQDDLQSPSSSVSTEIFQFDVYEREGYDQIMRTVAGSSEETEAFARSVCDYLEIFESLTPGRYVRICFSRV